MDNTEGKSWLHCPMCPMKHGGDISGCCVALRAALHQAAKQAEQQPQSSTESQSPKKP